MSKIPRSTAIKETPRYNLSEERRLALAVILYAAAIRAHDISAACKISNRRLTKEVRTKGIQLRSEVSMRGSLTLLEPVEFIRAGGTVAELVERYPLTDDAADAVVVLVRVGQPRTVREPPMGELKPEKRRCVCGGISPYRGKCPSCGYKW